MSAFSFKPTHHFPLDSVFMPKNTTTNMSNYMGDESNINNMNSTFPHQECLQDVYFDSKATACRCSDNDLSVTKKQNTDSNSSVVDMLEMGEQVTQRLTNMEKKRKNKYLSSLNSAQSKGNEKEISKKQKKSKGVEKNEQENKPKADKVENKATIHPPTGYIHVRARRGQATDSHSLAERVRREKISERMKVLQSLVPGCEKVTGKALVLDEIINYVQSLQNQVEFLSMKLVSMNPFFDFGMDLDDAFTLDPEIRVNSIQSLSQCNPTQPISTTFTDSTTTTTLNTIINYPLIDGSSLLLQQERPHATAFSQDGGSLVWDDLDQRHKFLNPSGSANILSSFH